MSTHRETWEELASRIEGLGLKIKYHLEQERSEGADAEAATDEAVAPASIGDVQDTVTDAFSKLGDMLDDAFESLANASKDEAVRTDVRDVGMLIKDAVASTISSTGAELNGIKEAIMRPKVADDVKPDVIDIQDDASE